MSSEDTAEIHVVAGVVMDAADHLLIAQRPLGKHLAGGWEFPGGKLEPGEERSAGLARELLEELGITIGPARPLIRVRHAYPARRVLLDVWVVRRYHGSPRGLEGQRLRWCTSEELSTADLLPADAQIVAALRLPETLTEMSTIAYSIGERSAIAPAERRSDTGGSDRGRSATLPARLIGVLCTSAAEAAAAVADGADFVALREPLAAGDLADLCGSIPVPVYARGLAPKKAWALGASGINALTEPPAVGSK